MKKKILLIEDNPYQIIFIEFIIKKNFKDFELTIVDNGFEVNEIIKNNKFDLILLDINLPGKDGIEILKDIKDLNIKSKVILTTAYLILDFRDKIIDFDIYNILHKPYLAEDLIKILINLEKES